MKAYPKSNIIIISNRKIPQLENLPLNPPPYILPWINTVVNLKSIWEIFTPNDVEEDP